MNKYFPRFYYFSCGYMYQLNFSVFQLIPLDFDIVKYVAISAFPFFSSAICASLISELPSLIVHTNGTVGWSGSDNLINQTNELYLFITFFLTSLAWRIVGLVMENQNCFWFSRVTIFLEIE